MADRIIMHVDLDAFYASVEEREDPELKVKPVIVGADPKNGTGRGVVATANYVAREFGVHSAMPISKAWKLCPQGIYIRPNFPLYAKASFDVMAIIRKYASKFQQVSIDEAFIDVTDKVVDFEGAGKLAEIMKRDIMNKEKISASVGIGPNKLIAKIASDYKKPYGLTIVKSEDVEKFLKPLPVRKLIGIGPKTESVLKNMGIDTVEQLSKIGVARLAGIFGTFGYRMHEMSLGIDESDVIEDSEMKSLGREFTFEKDTDDMNMIFNTISELVDNFHRGILSLGLQFKTIVVKIRYENFETHTKSKTIESYTDDKNIIKEIALELAKPSIIPEKKIRLIGVRVSNLKFGEKQKTLKSIK